MTIGSTFPVRGDDKIKSVPWNLLEANRQRALENHHAPLERLYALGGLTIAEIAEIVSPAKGQRSDADARKIVVAHTGKPEPKENGDEG